MKLTDAEKAMLDGREGRAKAKGMELLVRYGEALGAEQLVETRNVAGTWATSRFMTDFIARGMDAVFSEFNLDSDEVVETPHTVVSSCQLIAGVDHRNWRIQGVPEEAARAQAKAEGFFGRRGIQQFATCTPYQVGNVPVRGEHCAWMESSAVVYCNGRAAPRKPGSRRRPASSAASPRRSGFEEESPRWPNQFKLLIDENLSPRLVGFARSRGFYAVHVNEINLRTAGDKHIARYPVNNGMILVTNNVADFSRLYARRRLHPGLIFMQCAETEVFTDTNQATLLGVVLNDILEKDLIQEAIRINLIEEVGDRLRWELTRRPLPAD